MEGFNKNKSADLKGKGDTEKFKQFFCEMLADIEEPTLPFGLSDVYQDGTGISESHRMFTPELNARLRHECRRLGVSLASLCHLAWGMVLSRITGQARVVFGTVLFGRLQGGSGAAQAMGLFINTLPMRIDVDNTAAAVSVRAAHGRLAALLEHEHASLALAQRCSAVPAGTPLFSALLNYRHNASSPAAEVPAGERLSAEERTNYPFALSVEDFGDALGVTAKVQAPAEAARVCGYMQQALESLADALAQAPECEVRELETVPPEERTLLLDTWNRTEAPYPAEQCLHQLFEAQVSLSPSAPAVVYEDDSLSYGELNARANRLAHRLIAEGVKPDGRVGICVERGPAMIVGLLAILKAGGAYVPLDPSYPGDRLRYILQDAGPETVLADTAGRAALGEALSGLRVLDPGAAYAGSEDNPQVQGLTSRHLAYVIYTSGSTGLPKGVMIEHKNLVNFNTAMENLAQFSHCKRVLHLTSFSFDISVTETFFPLIHGNVLLMIGDVFSPKIELSGKFPYQNIDLIQATPSVWKALFKLNLDFDSNTRVLCGGETLTNNLAQELNSKFNNSWNMYGPTETTVWSTSGRIVGRENIHVGRPIANTRLYLLNEQRQPVPLGAPGELYIGGAGVARGYLNRPELTDERFLADPFSDTPGARMYKTGDLARYLPDGNLVFLGRNDHQVKIRGFRIEPGEIEARLAEHPDVREAVVMARDDGHGGLRLVAYVVGDADAGTLRQFLSGRLPEYMVPAAFVPLTSLPLTPNGKLDRRALPAPDGEAFAREAYEAPQGDEEEMLATIWSELLGQAQISRHDSFFALGGHSLLAVQMIDQLRRRGVRLAVQDLFKTPVLSALALRLTPLDESPVPDNLIPKNARCITPEMLPLVSLTQPEIDRVVASVQGGVQNVQDIYGLSPLQDGILFHHLLAAQGDPYLLVGQMAFNDRRSLDRYLAALQRVVARHDILRTGFVWQGMTVPVQVVWREAPLAISELTLDPADGPIGRQLAERFNPHHHRIDLSQAPLIRFAIAQDGDGRWLLLELMHHLIGDHSTLEIMHHEVQAFLADSGAELAPPQPFRNLIAQIRQGKSEDEHKQFFGAMLADIEEPTLPFGLSDVYQDGTGISESHRMFTPELNARLRHECRRLGVSLASLCHLAWGMVLSRITGQARVVFGTVLFGRLQGGSGAAQAMGLFINTLPVRIDVDNTAVAVSVRAAHGRLAALLEHEHASLALAQRCSAVPAGTPLFSALLNYRHNASSPAAEVPAGERLSAEERTNYPFALSVEDFGDALGVTAQVQAPAEAARVCGYMQQALESLADALAQAPECEVRELETVPPEERTLLLDTWNRTEAPYPAEQCLHQLFEAQVSLSPSAPAVVYEDDSLSYGELNARANRLAHRLIAEGVKPDGRVGICVERGPAMIVGLLAILKAGGAYVPLDPSYPGDRLRYILQDAGPETVLADTAGRAALGEALSGLRVLDPGAAYAGSEDNPQVQGLTSRHLAYVIYTSGSTGLPKGVMVEHRSLVNLCVWHINEFSIVHDSVSTTMAGIAFDAACWEIWPTLIGGGLLDIPDKTNSGDNISLLSWFKLRPINIAFLVTPLADLALKNGLLPDSLRYLLIGGDNLSQVSRWIDNLQLINNYGPTETTIVATSGRIVERKNIHVGRPIANTRLYLLNEQRQPVPLGAPGELYIGGAGVARGYLNRPELTDERFLADPFSDIPGARMYKTGDLARYLPDGNLVFLGRNDHQVKIRGFRIEPGEIEARLAEHPDVRETVVMARDDGHGGLRLVAYVVGDADAGTLRQFLSGRLPEYMVPAAFVPLTSLPLTPNGKLDRRALPAPDGEAFAREAYEAPQGDEEEMLATIWSELLGQAQISRHDSFFALGGHSLLAVQMIDQLRRRGVRLAVQDLFKTPVLSALALRLTPLDESPVPDNLIPKNARCITPEMLPLVSLTQPEIDRVVASVQGGVQNVQDIYGLSPLQDGILFHHLLAAQGDPYLLVDQMAFNDRRSLDRYLAALQRVVARHDILRTGFVWQGMTVPVQVVWREAPLAISELTLDPADEPIGRQLAERFNPRHHRIDLSQAPLIRFAIAQDGDGRWLLLELMHHLIGDHSTLEIMHHEVQAFLADSGAELAPPQPFRNLIAQIRQGKSEDEHKQFFGAMLANIEEPTLPFGLSDVYQDGTGISESHRMFTPELNARLRHECRRLGVSLASLCHLAWGMVLSRITGQARVVFGTVLFGRLQGGSGAAQAMGLFINTLPVRIDVDNTAVAVSVRAAHGRLAALLEHEHASLALAQRCSAVPAGTPLFSALLNYRHNASSPAAEVPAGERLSAEERTNYPFALSVEDFGDALGVTAKVQAPAEAARVCGYMQQALESLADALAQAPECEVRELETVPPEERTLLLDTWNRTEAPYPAEQCLHQLFEAQVSLSPSAPAVVYEDDSLSYGELNARANRLAHRLIAEGVKPDGRVGICVERGPAMIVGLLAILKAGGAYVPLDPSYPGDRLRYILQDAGPETVLADTAGRAALGEALSGLRVLDPGAAYAGSEDNPQVQGLTSRHLAYVIYTSGSTGLPKGVMVEHDSLLNLYAYFLKNIYSHFPKDVKVALNASISFDSSVKMLFSLLYGCSLSILPQDIRLDLDALIGFVKKCNIDILDCTPVQLNHLIKELPSPEKKPLTLFVGGDVITKNTWEDIVNTKDLNVYNVYGPTECTVDSTIALIQSVTTIPIIGRPIANTRLYLLNEQRQPVPLGAPGELYIGGAGVARGYLNRPELTDERFLADPFSDIPGARMYKTGDLARYLPDGNLVFLGRNDHQVKIRGFRIEPGEIEARLAEHPDVREAVVMARDDGQGGLRLVAYVVGDADAGTLRQFLSGRLPEYMVPAAFVPLTSLPLTPNGKLDRRALPAPDGEAFAREAYEAPQGDEEEMLATIWSELLGVPQISRHDSFFALGGHSLLAMRLVNMLAARGISASLSLIFANPVLQNFAACLIRQQDQDRQILPPIKRSDREEYLPLSFAQQRLWFLAQMDGQGEVYHIPMALHLKGALDVDALQYALNSVFSRHEAWRSTFVTHDGKPQVKLLAAEHGLPLQYHDLRGQSDVAIATFCADEAHTAFDLVQGPLVRARLLALAHDEHVFLLTQHHIVSDGWSFSVLVTELSTLYQAALAGEASPLAPLAIQYPDYAAWQRQYLSGELLQSQADYWRETLADAPVLLDLPTDRPRPDKQSLAGAFVPVCIDAATTEKLKALSQKHGVTLFMVLIAAWGEVLSRLSGQSDLVIGTPSANRGRHETEALIGFFVNTLAIRIDLSEELNTAALLKQVRDRVLAAQEHQDLPFEQIVEMVNPPRSLAYSPLFQVMLAWQNMDKGEWQLPGLTVQPFELEYDVAKFDLELHLGESNGEITGALGYSTALFDQETIQRHVGYLEAVLQAMIETQDRPLSAVDILSATERTLLLDTWNRTEAPYPAEQCLHQLFEAQVSLSPSAPAVVYEDDSLSYGELNARANRLAHRLIAEGVKPDGRVGICVERGPAMIVGLLAILKAGGAYVPLDPSYPGDRLRYILQDAGPETVLADTAGRAALGEALSGLRVLDPGAAYAGSEDNPQVQGLTSRHLAYVIYTSGSTGLPKGVMVEHQQVGRLLTSTDRYFHFNAHDVWCLFHSFAFDFSVWEMWGAWGHGGKLIIVPQAVSRSPIDFYRLVCREGVTVLNQTPSAFKAFYHVRDNMCHQLRYVIFGGEMLKPKELTPWYAHNAEQSPLLVNMYGITETTIHVTHGRLSKSDTFLDRSPIGQRIIDLRIYLLNEQRQPVPLGAPGELYIGGAGVARGYLNRPELTDERFLADPFSDIPGARMYKTGDLARYLPDGNLVFLGRNDHQVKIRGFRIEPGEIEARLAEHPDVREAVVMARDDGHGGLRLVAYVVGDADAGTLRQFLSGRLPEYMVPAAFVPLTSLPLTPNGKLDRRALPAPDGEAFAREAYEAPQGDEEEMLATIWSELLGQAQISRHDSFFALGGHSLLAVQMIDQLRRRGVRLAVQDLFKTPVLSALALRLTPLDESPVPDNLIPKNARCITPEMLPLVSLTQPEIDRVVASVQGGVQNVQDIYGLSPLQDGILFHHLLAAQGDPYLLVGQMAFNDRRSLDRYLAALQRVVARHDILRTGFVWQGMTVPVQVVWREAPLAISELTLDPADGPIGRQLAERFNPRHHRIDLSQAPLIRFAIAQDGDGRWLLLKLMHHLIGDHSTLEIMHHEVQAFLADSGAELAPPQPFRNLIAQIRQGKSEDEHKQFFGAMLADIEEPTLPFGLSDVYQDGTGISESHRMFTPELNARLRHECRRLGVSLASLCHLAWGMVLSRITGQARVVFGTVLFGRLQGGSGAAQAMGLFINTLPVRIDVDNTAAAVSVRAAHGRLAALLEHEHASLALAQRCSAVPAGTPLFSALLNYRHNASSPAAEVPAGERLSAEERTNYPFALSVEDFGDALGVTAQVQAPAEAARVCGYMQQALESLADALAQAPECEVRELETVPPEERTLLLDTWNRTEAPYPAEQCLHQLFEAQVSLSPSAPAVVYEDDSLSYGELNARANRLAHRLIAEGVKPDGRVGICVERGPAMIVGLLAILKAGGAYVPLDPSYPGDRLRYILQDAGPETVLADTAGRAALGEALSGLRVLDPGAAYAGSEDNPQVQGLTSRHLAYVIYTSGSTGLPKGVMVEHNCVVNEITSLSSKLQLLRNDRILQFASFSFDASVEEIFMALSSGCSLILRDDNWLSSSNCFWLLCQKHKITVLDLPTQFWSLLALDGLPVPNVIRKVIIGGEAVGEQALRSWFVNEGINQSQLFNTYGPTETCISSIKYEVDGTFDDPKIIGRPIANTRLYLLNEQRQPVPLGAPGELYIGGAGVARGYLNRPELTDERFLADPFSDIPGARMYKTGDLARYLPDGNLVFLGRNDHQVKIRGFRIEPGEIEARLAEHPDVREAVVMARDDGHGGLRLVAYVVGDADAGTLRQFLSGRLPEYMVPAAFVPLTSLPLTPNGKLDRRALPAPDGEAFAREAYEAPQGVVEEMMAAIWSELLGVPQISRHDSFFALGGNSLLAIKLINKLTMDTGLSISLKAIFDFPMLSGFSDIYISVFIAKKLSGDKK